MVMSVQCSRDTISMYKMSLNVSACVLQKCSPQAEGGIRLCPPSPLMCSQGEASTGGRAVLRLRAALWCWSGLFPCRAPGPPRHRQRQPWLSRVRPRVAPGHQVLPPVIQKPFRRIQISDFTDDTSTPYYSVNINLLCILLLYIVTLHLYIISVLNKKVTIQLT